MSNLMPQNRNQSGNPDFFSSITSGNYGSNEANTGFRSPSGFGGRDIRNQEFGDYSNMGGFYGATPSYLNSIGLQPSNFYGNDLSFYSSSGNPAPEGSYGSATGNTGIYFQAPSNMDENASFKQVGDGGQYGGLENTINSSIGYNPNQYSSPTYLNNTNARAGTAKSLLEDNSGVSYADSNYNFSKPTSYDYNDTLSNSYGQMGSFGRGSVSGKLSSPNANSFGFTGQIDQNNQGYANQSLNLDQSLTGDQGFNYTYSPDNSFFGRLSGNTAPVLSSLNDFANVSAMANANTSNQAGLNGQGILNSNFNTGSSASGQNISPLFGNLATADASIGNESNINLLTGESGQASGQTYSNSQANSTGGVSQTQTLDQGITGLGKPQYYTYKDTSGKINVTSDAGIAAKAGSTGKLDLGSPQVKQWESRNVDPNVKNNFNDLKQTLPGIFGQYPDYDAYLAYQYSNSNPSASSKVSQDTRTSASNNAGRYASNTNQALNFSTLGDASLQGNTGSSINSAMFSDPLAMTNNTATTTNIQGSAGNNSALLASLNNILSSGGVTNNSMGSTGSQSNANTSGYINSTNTGNFNSYSNGAGNANAVYGIAAPTTVPTNPIISPFIVNPNPSTSNISIGNSTGNLNNLFY